MKLSRIKPFDWFKREQSETGQLLPRRRDDDPITRMHRDMTRLFEDFVGAGLPDWPSPSREMLLQPEVDIAESKKAYRISVEVPGVEEKDLDLSIEGDTLVVSGEKRQEHEDDEEGFHRVERRYGRFRRLLTLPGDADADNIKASFGNGVLRIRIPRSADGEAPGRRRISIR